MTIEEQRALIDTPEFQAMYKLETLPMLHDWCIDQSAYTLALCIRSHYQPIKSAEKPYTYQTCFGFTVVFVDEMFLFSKTFDRIIHCLEWWDKFKEKQS